MIDQVAALPYRYDAHGNFEVMLITPRNGKDHWIPPKGDEIKGLAPYEAAAQEAFVEAGLMGQVSKSPLGNYYALKSAGKGRAKRINVRIYSMRVDDQVGDWPQKMQRSALWFEPSSAARVVREPELARLIECFKPPVAAAA